MKSLAQVSAEKRAAIRQIEAAHSLRMRAAHSEFNAAYNAALAQHGLDVNTLMDHHNFPAAFHQDVAPAKATYYAAKKAADDARAVAARDVVRPGSTRISARRVKLRRVEAPPPAPSQ